MKRLVVLSCLALLTAEAAAQPSGTGGEVACHASIGHLVIGRDRADDVGTEFLVRRRTEPGESPRCAFEPQPADYRIGGPGQPLHFQALAGEHLVLTASTGPSATLAIHDLAGRRRVLNERMTEASEPKVEGDRVTFTLRVGAATAKTCKQLAAFKKQGGSGEIGAPASFDLASGKLTRGTGTVCTYAQ